jgi:hypothetical protein
MVKPHGSQIWSVDTEWGFRDHRLDQESAWVPVVLCLVGLRSGRRLSFWGADQRLNDFFRDHADDLFVGHYVIAEMKYLLRLAIPLPTRWFDTFLAWRYITNRPNYPEANLSAALHHLGLPHLAPATKKELQEKIVRLNFDPNSPVDQREIINYCFSDCDGCGALFDRISDRVDSAVMAHWVEYLNLKQAWYEV